MASNVDVSDFVSSFEFAILETLEVEVKDEIIEMVKEHIDSDVYDKYTPEEYNRTQSLKNNLIGYVDDLGRAYELTVEYNDDEPYFSIVTGESLSMDYIAGLIEDGKIKPLWGDGYEYLKPRPFMENTQNEIDSDIGSYRLDKAIQKGLNRTYR